jgi:hypothetical protein
MRALMFPLINYGNWIKIHIGYESSNVLIITDGFDYESSHVLIIDYGIANSHIMETCEKVRALKSEL